MTLEAKPVPIPAVGIVCFNDDGQVLLIRRGNPPRQGEWSMPGGKLEWGEKAVDAALRELAEETGVTGEILGLIDVVDGIFTSRTTGNVTRHYVLIDYVAYYLSGTVAAGDDASEARFVALDTIETYGLWDETIRIIHAGYKLWQAARN
ncbi:MAG: NUDIX hydrolase [Aquidulcibacter sp.]|jgi:8-oxo-dGTP diphosphatase|uniref:NUDIX hydrolase n=1 Tax=Aquidulcibacter sp. TaxID=2052990 RepID=UPI0022C2FE33|nr:NUDIX hydrolase [Aquidulcibacter sp.]MCE2890793.1 NUDIX hydrolase [Hyphomonadaceae bacterium]MCZ8207222.1 NUDIX hydrolase [Aquidulcibacter sp.]